MVAKKATETKMLVTHNKEKLTMTRVTNSNELEKLKTVPYGVCFLNWYELSSWFNVFSVVNDYTFNKRAWEHEKQFFFVTE